MIPPLQKKAFYRIMVWDSGTFDLVPLPEEPRVFEHEISMSTEGLLMEGMRQLDEMRRLGDDLPALSEVLQIPVPLETDLREASPEELQVIQLAHNLLTRWLAFSIIVAATTSKRVPKSSWRF
ncbi:MAG: DUF4388 domain-containing protein [Polyangiales bacterium]